MEQPVHEAVLVLVLAGLGGRVLLLRLLLGQPCHGLTCADAGASGASGRRSRSPSTGVGIRYKTPIGPLRLDLGRILNPPDGMTNLRVHFSVGHAF